MELASSASKIEVLPWACRQVTHCMALWQAASVVSTRVSCHGCRPSAKLSRLKLGSREKKWGVERGKRDLLASASLYWGLHWWLSGKKSTCNAGDVGLIPGSRRSPGGRNGNLLQYSCLKNSIDRGAWQATVHRVAKSQKRLSPHAVYFYLGRVTSTRTHAYPWRPYSKPWAPCRPTKIEKVHGENSRCRQI